MSQQPAGIIATLAAGKPVWDRRRQGGEGTGREKAGCERVGPGSGFHCRILPLAVDQR